MLLKVTVMLERMGAGCILQIATQWRFSFKEWRFSRVNAALSRLDSREIFRRNIHSWTMPSIPFKFAIIISSIEALNDVPQGGDLKVGESNFRFRFLCCVQWFLTVVLNTLIGNTSWETPIEFHFLIAVTTRHLPIRLLFHCYTVCIARAASIS